MSANTLRSMASAGTMGAAELIRRQQAAASSSTSGSGLGPQTTASIKQPPMAGKYQPPPAAINPVQPAPVVQQPQTATVVATVVPAAPHAKAMNEDEPHLVVSPPSTSKLASLGGVKGTAHSQSAESKQPKDAAENGSNKGKKRSKKEESDDEEEEASGDESSGDSSSESGDSGSESDGSSSGEEDDDDSESESEDEDDKKDSKKRKPKDDDKKKKAEKKVTKGKKEEKEVSKKPKKDMEKAKKTKPLKPTHESSSTPATKEKKGSKKSKKEEGATAAPATTAAAAAEPEPKSYPYTPELTPPIHAVVATEILAKRKPHTKEQEAEIEKDENSNHTHCADMVAKGYTLIHSASYSIDAVSFRKDAAEKAEAEEANKKKSSSEDGVPASDKGRGQVAITAYIKALSESPYDHFDVWWSEEKNRAYIACTFRVAEFLAQNPKIDGPDAYRRVRCVLGKVHARLARAISQRPSRSPNSKRTYYTNTIFNEKSFGADKDLGTTAENPKWVPEPLWSSDQIKAELKAVADDATKRELRKQEQELAEAHEEDKRRERAKEEEKSTSKKRAKEEEKKKDKEEEKKASKQTSKKSRTEAAAAAAVPPPPAPVAMMVDIAQHHLTSAMPSSSLISMLTKQQQELSATIAQLTVAIDSAKAAFNTNHALMLKVQGTSAQ